MLVAMIMTMLLLRRSHEVFEGSSRVSLKLRVKLQELSKVSLVGFLGGEFGKCLDDGSLGLGQEGIEVREP